MTSTETDLVVQIARLEQQGQAQDRELAELRKFRTDAGNQLMVAATRDDLERVSGQLRATLTDVRTEVAGFKGHVLVAVSSLEEEAKAQRGAIDGLVETVGGFRGSLRVVGVLAITLLPLLVGAAVYVARALK